MALYKSGRCCCWPLKSGVMASALFLMMASGMQILAQVAVWASHSKSSIYYNTMPYVLFLPLMVLDFLLAILSMILLCMLEQQDSQKKFRTLVIWLLFWLIYALYEIIATLYFFGFTFTQMEKYGNAFVLGTEIAYLVVPLVYLGIKILIYILGMSASWSYYMQRNGENVDMTVLKDEDDDDQGSSYAHNAAKSLGPFGADSKQFTGGNPTYFPGSGDRGSMYGTEPFRPANQPRNMPARYPAGYPSYTNPLTQKHNNSSQYAPPREHNNSKPFTYGQANQGTRGKSLQDVNTEFNFTDLM